MKKFILVAGFLFLSSSFLFSQTKKEGKIELSLNECIEKALKNNLDISVEAYNPEIQDFSISEQKGMYWPRLQLEYSKFNYNQLSNWWVEGSNFITKQDEMNIRLFQMIPTGGELSLGLASSTTDSTRSLSIVNPTYNGRLTFHFNQPLLKDFGLKINRKDIIKTQNQRDIAEYNLNANLALKVYEVEQAYWNFVSAIESLKVNELSIEKSKEMLKNVKEAARMGTKSELDVLISETELASLENALLTAQSQVEMSERTLREIINLPTDVFDISVPIFPLDKPTIEKKEITFEEALKHAYENRPEIARSQKTIENSNIDISYYKNQALPQLNLDINYSAPGQSGDILLYKDSNPLSGIIVGKIEGSRADSFRDVFRLKYDNWRVALNLTIPLQSFFSRASLAKAKLEKEKNLVEMEQQKKSIYYDVLEAYNDMKNKEKRISFSTRYKKLMEQKLDAEEQKYQLGIGDINWVLEYRRELAQAKQTEIGAIISYKISVVNLEKVMGINLKTKKLKFKNYDF